MFKFICMFSNYLLAVTKKGPVYPNQIPTTQHENPVRAIATPTEAQNPTSTEHNDRAVFDVPHFSIIFKTPAPSPIFHPGSNGPGPHEIIYVAPFPLPPFNHPIVDFKNALPNCQRAIFLLISVCPSTVNNLLPACQVTREHFHHMS